ncbi:flagellar biosynthetic protein FlhB [Peribacillus deserti]|uniref:Flagellar biosynthetic protein FlhB n=1 Tax=Peribacillus deserti TaxID=673318 RepID=A0ABS2QHF4_9BACI|nr:flagellar biosynthesis protein FlhB [Peribacillus deserti]MBM7692249.1 flagellar biosynthetic protein FlhB [Peribacillus deserti]
MKLLHLDLQYFSGEKTEKATPKKREDARKKGQTAKSQDLNTAIVLLAVFFLLMVTGPSMLRKMMFLFTEYLKDFSSINLKPENIQPLFVGVIKELTLLLAPVLGVALLAGAAANYFQVGVMFSTEAIQFKLEKLNPISGFKRIVSLRAIVELLKSILKIAIVGLVTFLVIWNKLPEIMLLSQKSAGDALSSLAKITISVGLFASGALLFLSLLDYLYQKFDFEKSIRMSKQDIKDEYKNIEGDPLIKSKIKQRQREMAMQRMMQEVPKADVVITNPTHYAIALKYDDEKNEAPYVVAKGVDFIAKKIKLIASENDIAMVENRPLARALHDGSEIGQAIPEEFFKAIAEILAYVYKLKGKI